MDRTGKVHICHFDRLHPTCAVWRWGGGACLSFAVRAHSCFDMCVHAYAYLLCVLPFMCVCACMPAAQCSVLLPLQQQGSLGTAAVIAAACAAAAAAATSATGGAGATAATLVCNLS